MGGWGSQMDRYSSKIQRHPDGVTSGQGSRDLLIDPPSEDLEVYPLLLTSPVSSHTAKILQLYWSFNPDC